MAHSTIDNTQTHLGVTNLTTLPDMAGQTLAEALVSAAREATAQVALTTEQGAHNTTKGQLTAAQAQVTTLTGERDDYKKKYENNCDCTEKLNSSLGLGLEFDSED
jgi:hypothetical protein